MACQAINSWTFSELVAAFVDLSITYCLLCASAFSYFASKFLALFGLCLPCPCDGLFWNPGNNANCLQRQLADIPYEKISLVHSAVQTKSPFETPLDNEDCDRIVESDHENQNNVLDCGVSSGLFKLGVEFGERNVNGLKEGEYGVVGKRVVGRRGRHGLHRRRRGGSVSNGKLSSVSSYDTLRSDARNTPQSPPSISKNRNDVFDDANDFGGGRESLADFDFFERDSLGLEFKNPNLGNKDGEAVVVEELEGNGQRDLGVGKNVKNNIRLLEQALEEEQAYRSALYVELEKERSAAASAADEAMAMILRLQEEKASIEMEARQYQRMMEAKTAYDAEEMNILKEILLRREREKHFLEKEVEGYRQMVFGNYESDSGTQDVAATPYSSEDPISILQQINESIEKPKLKIVKSSSDNKVSSVKSLNRTLAFEKELTIPEPAEDDESLKHVDMSENLNVETLSHTLINCDPIEEGHTLSIEACSKLNILSNPLEFDRPMNAEQPISTSLCTDLASKSSEYQESKDPPDMVLDSESCVYDVHVIDDESKRSSSVNMERNDLQSGRASLNIPRYFGSSSFSALDTLYDTNRSSSDVTIGLPSMSGSMGKARSTGFRRNSMSAVDYERVKIDNEVELLRERLRMVQKGREKLNFSVGLKEREMLQLQLLEDIVGQLRAIRQSNEPGKAEQRASLPPSYSKGTVKKRRWRSTSLNIHQST